MCVCQATEFVLLCKQCPNVMMLTAKHTHTYKRMGYQLRCKLTIIILFQFHSLFCFCFCVFVDWLQSLCPFLFGHLLGSTYTCTQSYRLLFTSTSTLNIIFLDTAMTELGVGFNILVLAFTVRFLC